MRAFFVAGGLLAVVLIGTGRAQTAPPADAPAPAPAETPAPADAMPAAASHASPHEESVQRHLAFLTKELALAPDQQERVLPLLRQEADEAAGVYAKPDPVAQPREIFRVRKQAVDRICPLLTPEQRETLLKTKRGEYLD